MANSQNRHTDVYLGPTKTQAHIHVNYKVKTTQNPQIIDPATLHDIQHPKYGTVTLVFMIYSILNMELLPLYS